MPSRRFLIHPCPFHFDPVDHERDFRDKQQGQETDDDAVECESISMFEKIECREQDAQQRRQKCENTEELNEKQIV